MGAQAEGRAAQFRKRHAEWEDTTGEVPPFHYGTHFSSAAATSLYLLRLEPFTTLAIRLQGGVFDHADRLFHDVGATYRNATTNSADVKEAIPELYYLPEALVNANGVALGVRQDGTALGDVVLPPWANGSAHDFVRLHRAALESAHVSAHLHEWVDLVFGHKQRGKAAVAALNVFYYLTYEGEVDLDKISDEHERAATEAQIVNFGNTPTQLIADKPAAPRGDGPHNAAAERTTPPDERRERAPSLSLSPQTAHALHLQSTHALPRNRKLHCGQHVTCDRSCASCGVHDCATTAGGSRSVLAPMSDRMMMSYRSRPLRSNGTAARRSESPYVFQSASRRGPLAGRGTSSTSKNSTRS